MQFTSPHGTKHKAAYDCLKPEPISKTSATQVTLRTSWQEEVSDPITARASSIHSLEWPHAEGGHGNNEGTG